MRKCGKLFVDNLNHYDQHNVCLRGEMDSNLALNDTRKILRTVLKSSIKSNMALLSSSNANNFFLSDKKQLQVI